MASSCGETDAQTPKRHRLTNRSIDLFGWILFLGSAVCFLVASWGDPWGMAGSVLFFVACLVFLIPFFRQD